MQENFQTCVRACVRACVSGVSQQKSTLKCFIRAISPAVSMLFLVVSRFKNLVVTFFLLVCKGMLHLHGLTYDGMKEIHIVFQVSVPEISIV